MEIFGQLFGIAIIIAISWGLVRLYNWLLHTENPIANALIGVAGTAAAFHLAKRTHKWLNDKD